MSRRGNVGLRRMGDVEEQVNREDEEILVEDEETNAWAQRRIRRMVKVQQRQEQKERKRAYKVAKDRSVPLDQ
jgi:hypothetical protein